MTLTYLEILFWPKPKQASFWQSMVDPKQLSKTCRMSQGSKPVRFSASNLPLFHFLNSLIGTNEHKQLYECIGAQELTHEKLHQTLLADFKMYCLQFSRSQFQNQHYLPVLIILLNYHTGWEFGELNSTHKIAKFEKSWFKLIYSQSVVLIKTLDQNCRNQIKLSLGHIGLLD